MEMPASVIGGSKALLDNMEMGVKIRSLGRVEKEMRYLCLSD